MGIELITENDRLRSDITVAVFVSIAVSAAWFVVSWRFGFDLADEGFYWYGAQRILYGELPMLDYQSYDIGRYYWAAAVMYALGDSGIFAARVAGLTFQGWTIGVGTFLCLWAMPVRKPIGFRLVLALTATLTLTLWMVPYYKTFDHGASIVIVGMVVLLLKSISVRAWFVGGLLLGAMAMIGRNHGVYGAVAAFFALGFWVINAPQRSCLIRPATGFVLGVFLSFSPTFLIMLWAPDFKVAFVESVLALIRSGETNIGIPIPWPWNFDLRQLGWLTWAYAVTTGIGFVMLLLVPTVAVAALFRQRLANFSSAHIVLLAAAMTGIPYAHYAYSRADLTHLALGIFPLLLALFAIGVIVRAPLSTASGLLLLSTWAVSDFQPLLEKHLWQRKFEQIEVSGQSLFTSPGTALRIELANAALARHPEASQNFLAQPNMPSLHAMHEAKIPIWEIYSLFPRAEDFENAELARLVPNPPKLILISDHALDNREEFRYSRMHPLIYAWVQENYVLEKNSTVVDSRQPGKLDVYVPKAKAMP